MHHPWPSPRPNAQWVFAGLLPQFPDVGPDQGNIIQPRACPNDNSTPQRQRHQQQQPGCRILHVPKTDPVRAEAVAVPAGATTSPPFCAKDLKDQVVVFRYRERIHAVDHQCPHNAYPLSNGSPFDIEDFGVVLSAGITCPKHGWSFDLFTGLADRGAYRLPVWEVQLRDAAGQPWTDGNLAGKAVADETTTVWVRRKQKIG